MRVVLHPAAEAELQSAVQYYEERQVGLGLEFAEEVYATLARIEEHPEAWSRVSANTRRCLLHRFPFGVIYQVRLDGLHIIAIAHLHRRPGYWKERLDNGG